MVVKKYTPKMLFLTFHIWWGLNKHYSMDSNSFTNKSGYISYQIVQWQCGLSVKLAVNKFNYDVCWEKITFSEQLTNLFYNFDDFFLFCYVLMMIIAWLIQFHKFFCDSLMKFIYFFFTIFYQNSSIFHNLLKKFAYFLIKFPIFWWN